MQQKLPDSFIPPFLSTFPLHTPLPPKSEWSCSLLSENIYFAWSNICFGSQRSFLKIDFPQWCAKLNKSLIKEQKYTQPFKHRKKCETVLTGQRKAWLKERIGQSVNEWMTKVDLPLLDQLNVVVVKDYYMKVIELGEYKAIIANHRRVPDHQCEHTCPVYSDHKRHYDLLIKCKAICEIDERYLALLRWHKQCLPAAPLWSTSQNRGLQWVLSFSACSSCKPVLCF